MSSRINEDNVNEWLLMDIPNDQDSEDEYDLDDGDTDEQAQQQVLELRNVLFCKMNVKSRKFLMNQ